MKVGDVVKLKSDGPPMTVEEIGDDLVTCKWFDKAGTLQRDEFVPETIEVVQKTPPKTIGGTY